jgi:tetratricopeptide (TPR) repeat protein
MDKTLLLLSPYPWGLFAKAAFCFRQGALAASMVMAGTSAGAQERFLPAASDVVLASSVHASGERAGELRALEQAWRAQTQDLPAALAYARAVFTLGFNEGDLRWFGSAKAAMMPWWQTSEMIADGFFMRGLVKQGFHDFDGGLQDIQKAIALNPQRAEFWSWRFALHLLLADMRAAEQVVNEMARLFGPQEAQIYRAVWLYRTGQATDAVRLLRESIRSVDHQDASSQVWIGFHLGEAHRVAGQPDQAIKVWQQILQAQPRSHLLRLSLAELLNQQGRFAEAKAVATHKKTSSSASQSSSSLTDALLVQALLASRGLGSSDEAALAGQMQARLQAQALRQESLIERPKLIYQITYGQDLAAGLALSIENWQLQKEPPDALLFVQAALAMNQARAAEPVVNWAQTTSYTEPLLRQGIAQLMAHPSWLKDRP